MTGAVLLLALGIALGGRWGQWTAFLAVGLAAAGLEPDERVPLDLDRPVTLNLRVTGNWTPSDQGWRAPARSVWLRQGRNVDLWTNRLWIAVSAGASPPAESALRMRGYLRRAPPAANGGASAPGPWILRVKSRRMIDAVGDRRLDLNRMMYWVGERLGSWVESCLGRDLADGRQWSVTLVRVLMLGRADVLPAAVTRGLRAAGLAHLIALSGLHVGLLAGLVLMATAGARPGYRFSLAALTVVGYVCLAGARPSLIRSTLMLFAVVGAWLLRRAPQATNTLAWVAGGMVLLQPAITRDLGFQLTVSATTGILVLAPRLQRRWAWIPAPLGQALSVSLGAILGALPWTSSSFHLVSPLAPLWNLLAVPWAGLTLALVFGWVMVSTIAPPAARIPESLLELMGAPLELLGSLPPEILLPVPVSVGWWEAASITAALIGLLLATRRARIASAIGLACMCWVWRSELPSDPELIVIDVGQGDAILVRDGQHAMLVDGGGWMHSDIAQRILVPALARVGVRRLDAMVLTHPDIDHCGGLLALASYIPIDRFYTGPGWYGVPCVGEILSRAGVEVAPLWRGQKLDMARWRLRVLHPGAGARRGRNNRSLVLLAETSNRRVLLTGDLEVPGEREILETYVGGALGEVDVLKIGHHGSKTSTSPELLSRVRPTLALISCGRGNRYGHPSPKILDRLQNEQILILRTDLHGAIRIALPSEGPMRIGLPGLPRRQ